MISFIYNVSTIVIIGSILVLVTFGLNLLSSLYRESKFVNNSEKANETLNQLNDTIKLSVMITNKSFVEKLKQSNSFLQQDKEEAFFETKNRILSIANDKDLEFLKPYINNVDEWINGRIEYYVRTSKNNK
ncbi:hypothetical protein [Serpentinicella alkaliphila]|uniref:Uncharacterized protein n=1 Tax=Serpentinicella alkaliphila TaxID=1734049 RepID=A0A4R2SVH3_9FIRM|nr:hypothetical protein [Serpentinicella alkaliphila]QUH27053.1 hypothetical protein HZR23_15885 [Serpentinicella alkaliphila]TCP93285.1 hypothetical protein EDD79_10856 [Serpentinicella alkaliphila]